MDIAMITFCVCVLLVSMCWSFPLSGWIQSPGFPYGYDAHVKVTWRHCAPPGHTLSLSLLHLDIEDSYLCENDALQIFVDSRLVANLCGIMTLQKLQSSVNPLLKSPPGGCISLCFQSDYSNMERHTGFQAFYAAHDVDECWENLMHCSQFCHNYIGGYSCSCKPGFVLDEDQHTCRVNCTEDRYGEGVLVSLGSPGPYAENADCSYRLSVDEGAQIELKFIGVFDLEIRDGQCIDYVEIKADSVKYGPFCGRDTPPDILIMTQSVEVIFHSDENKGANEGFILIYRPKPMECPGKVTDNAVWDPVRDQYKVGATVHVHCVTGHIWTAPNEKTFQSRCQVNGKWSPVYSCELVNCTIPYLPHLMVMTEKHSLTTYGHNISVSCHAPFYYLVGEESFSCDANGQWVSANGRNFSHNALQCVPVCGRPTVDLSGRGRILKGELAKKGAFPWQVFLLSGGRGGAMVIGEQWLLTAAHSLEKVSSAENVQVHVGSIDVGELVSSPPLPVESFHIHPGFKLPEYDNDIALIKLKSPITFNEDIMPVCLPEQDAKLQQSGWVSGFGVTEDWASSNYLRYIKLPIVDQRVCKASLEEAKMTHDDISALTENMFCAGLPEGGGDTCQGDSGSAFVMRNQDVFFAVGIVSWRVDCGKKGRYGVYTQVARYANWIKEIMQEN